MTVGFIPEMKRVNQVNLFLHPWFEDLMKLHYCDEHGSIPISLNLYENIMKLYDEFKNEKLLEDHFRPKLNGDEIMKLTGLEPGPLVQDVLDALREAQIEGKVNTKKEAEEFVRNLS
jgi:poly(A) polymerase